MYGCFNGGFLYGVVTAVLLCFVWNKMQKARTDMGQKNRPLDTFPDANQPNLTAGGIVRKSFISMLAFFLWMLIFVVASISISGYFPFVRASVC